MRCLITLLALIAAVVGAEQPDAIRSVDFRNFSYPWPKGYTAGTFALVDGAVPLERNPQGALTNIGVSIGEIQYGDLTGDGEDEALIFMTLTTGGSAIPGLVYIYQMRKAGPVLLWEFETGDRADGGLRDIRIKKGRLVVELNSPEDSYGDCCPTKYVRTVYRWRSTAFAVESKQTLMLPEQ